jgi:hypothetical protein
MGRGSRHPFRITGRAPHLRALLYNLPVSRDQRARLGNGADVTFAGAWLLASMAPGAHPALARVRADRDYILVGDDRLKVKRGRA